MQGTGEKSGSRRRFGRLSVGFKISVCGVGHGLLRCGKWTHEHAGELGVDLIFEYAGADKHDPYFSPLHVEDLDGQLESRCKQESRFS
ncbi:hypothetical protein VQ056_13630 [Paenibacillus sp. JTLBN-2024]